MSSRLLLYYVDDECYPLPLDFDLCLLARDLDLDFSPCSALRRIVSSYCFEIGIRFGYYSCSIRSNSAQLLFLKSVLPMFILSI
jgi:hypothetical protein